MGNSKLKLKVVSHKFNPNVDPWQESYYDKEGFVRWRLYNKGLIEVISPNRFETPEEAEAHFIEHLGHHYKLTRLLP